MNVWASDRVFQWWNKLRMVKVGEFDVFEFDSCLFKFNKEKMNQGRNEK